MLYFVDSSPPTSIPCWFCQDNLKIINNAFHSSVLAMAWHYCNNSKISYILNIYPDKWRVSSINLDFSTYKVFGNTADGIADLCILDYENNLWQYKSIVSLKDYSFLSNPNDLNFKLKLLLALL